jgi:hypothetical protein
MKFKVLKSTLSSNGGYVNTIEGLSESTVFGVKKTTKHRFLIKTDEVIEVGVEHDLPLGEYTQERRESQVPDRNTGEEITIVSVWLHKKAA